MIFCTTRLMADDDDYNGPEITLTKADKAYFQQLQHAVLTDDEKWISKEVVQYPFFVNMPTGTFKLKNEKELKRDFKSIFCPKIKKAVARQSSDSLFKNWQGLMVGDGEMWFGQIGVTNGDKMVWEYKILAINVPPFDFWNKGTNQIQ